GSVVAAFLLLDGGLEDVAERGAAVGRPVLSDSLLLFRDFQRLDGDRDAAGVLVDSGDGRINLVAHVEALGALLGAIAGEIGAFDEGGHIGVDKLHLDAVVLHGDDLAGHLAALLESADALHWITADLLDAEADALLG